VATDRVSGGGWWWLPWFDLLISAIISKEVVMI
jgi:hypothetical protein